MKKFNVIAAICGLGLGFVAAAPAAQATTFDLIPDQEGEVKLTNFQDGSMQAIGDTVIDLGFNVTSLEYNDNNYGTGLSRLFIDDIETENDYGLFKFQATDDGTVVSEADAEVLDNLGKHWLRAVAIDSSGNPIENGELEVGYFKFDFEQSMDIDLTFFDVEASGDYGSGSTVSNWLEYTGITHINGNALRDENGNLVQALVDAHLFESDGVTNKDNNLIARTGDDGDDSVILQGVTSFQFKLGQKFGADDNRSWEGDGVLVSGLKGSEEVEFAVASVPEPTTTISLGALAVAGMFGVKKRKKLNK